MRILFAVDGSECSRDAVRTADQMICPVGTEMKVVTVVDFSEPLPVVEDIKEKEKAAADKLVADTVAELQKTHPNAVVTGEILDGYVPEEIVRLAREWIADLIMLGSHGRSGLSEFLLGSVSRGVLLHAPCAVRIVRRLRDRPANDSGAHVLLALDSSEHSRHLVDHALNWPWKAGTKFRCVHVIKELDESLFLDPHDGFAATLAQHYDDAMRMHKGWIEDAARKINDKFAQSLATGEVLIGEPREKILELTEQWPADIVMLGSHGRQGIDKLILGSVSEAVATHAGCSVEVSKIPAFRAHKMHVII